MELIQYKSVISQLVEQVISSRYKRTFLGFLWTLISPLLTMTVTAVVFSLIMRFDLRDFAIYLFSGLVPWTFVANGINQGGPSLINNEGIIKKVYLPRHIFPVSVIIAVFIDIVFSTIALFVIALVLGAKITPALLFVPIAFLILFLFILGLTLIQSILTVYFRDAQHFTPILLQVWFYATPILYPLSYIPNEYQFYFKLNPMYHFIEMFRGPIYEGGLPSTVTIVICLTISVITLILGSYVFRLRSSDLVFRL